MTDVIAFLEDDDLWEPWHLEQSLAIMAQTDADLVTTSQALVDVDGNPAGEVFDFPTASGWVFRRQAFLDAGGFDTSFKIHHDNEFLGRWKKQGRSRVHVSHRTPDEAPTVAHVRHFSEIAVVSRDRPSVLRTIHENTIMGGIASDPARAKLSSDEHGRLSAMYGTIPW